MWAAFPPLGLAPVAFIAPVPLFLAVRSVERPIWALALGFGWGAAFFGLLLNWIMVLGFVAWFPLSRMGCIRVRPRPFPVWWVPMGRHRIPGSLAPRGYWIGPMDRAFGMVCSDCCDCCWADAGHREPQDVEVRGRCRGRGNACHDCRCFPWARTRRSGVENSNRPGWLPLPSDTLSERDGADIRATHRADTIDPRRDRGVRRVARELGWRQV